jgi:hypothetical protein
VTADAERRAADGLFSGNSADDDRKMKEYDNEKNGEEFKGL